MFQVERGYGDVTLLFARLYNEDEWALCLQNWSLSDITGLTRAFNRKGDGIVMIQGLEIVGVEKLNSCALKMDAGGTFCHGSILAIVFGGLLWNNFGVL